MIKRCKSSLLKSTFVKKKEWIWASILLLGGGFIIWAMCLDCGVIERGRIADIILWRDLRYKMWLASETICDAVVAYGAMLAAIVVLYYSVSENKRLGIPYRRIIYYTVGRHTIPALFVIVLLLTIFMLISHRIPLKHTMYTCAIYILVIQTFVIIEILLSTSYERGKKVICSIERKKYLEESTTEKIYNADWAYSFGHLEHAIHSGEFISDKKDFLIDFLWIPFDRDTGMLYKREYLWVNLSEKRLLQKIYQFYYVNILSAFQNFGGDENHLERNQLYMGIRDFIKALIEKRASCDPEEYYYMAFSGIMNGLVSSNVEDSLVFCDYVFAECLPEGEMMEKQLGLLVLFHEVLYMFKWGATPKQFRIKRLQGWKAFENKNISFYARFWETWTSMYNMSRYDKMRHFQRAMHTMYGYHNASIAISRMLIPMREKG